ncbi:coiled-coil domain-containing protein 62 [Megalops cyprinoides]|uniref:coiled-coil domain-containing protein 62 n=1 Tax=Megalops cyprinoides TaxID=118141 RepID=UPI00186512C0|nr:coiled-coil domain-containing protein 62 [Megalops cyprinoides]
MEEGKRTFSSDENARSPAPNFSHTFVSPSDHWHSTPIKKNHVRVPAEVSSVPKQLPAGSGAKRVAARSLLASPECSLIVHGKRHDQKAAVEAEGSIVQKQRRELQLLMAELKDRDQELNDMVAAHNKQMQAWEHDRQRVLTLEQRSARLESELQKRSEVIRALTKQLRIAEARQQDGHRELNNTQMQLHQLSQQQQLSASQCQDLEERNQSLNSTVLDLSSQMGRLQAREEELSAMLKLKDKDVTEATNLIVDLTGRFQKLEVTMKEFRSREVKALKEMEEHKRRFRDARLENVKLKEELQEKTAESNAQREEVIRLKQENQRLERELAVAGEGESWKDELLRSARSKQERTESELHCLRQVYENQQNDLQLLQLNLECAQEALMQRESRVSPGSQGDLTCLLLDSPPGNRRSPGLVNGPSPSRTSPCLATNGDQRVQPPSPDSVQEEQYSPTSRLRRLLTKSQQMVASLELNAKRPDCPAHSPTNGSLHSPSHAFASSPVHSPTHGCTTSRERSELGQF